MLDRIEDFGAAIDLNALIKRDKSAIFSRDLWDKMAQLDYLNLTVEPQLGGMGLSVSQSVITIEKMANVCLDEGVLFAANAQLLSVIYPLSKFGSPYQETKFLQSLANGDKIAAHGMTEASGGSDPFRMNTTAKQVGDLFILNGKKVFITNAPIADYVLVYAMTAPEKGVLGGVTCFILESGLAGVTLGERISTVGLRTSTVGNIDFDNVKVGHENVLGGIGGGFRIFQESMCWERLGMSAMMIGIMDRILNSVAKSISIKGLKKYQAVTHPIAQIKAELMAVKALVALAAKSIDCAGKDAPVLTSSCKLLASDLLLKLALNTQRIRGAQGLIEGSLEELQVRNALASGTYSGTSDIQKNIILGHMSL